MYPHPKPAVVGAAADDVVVKLRDVGVVEVEGVEVRGGRKSAWLL